jgi:hypothetical protein
VVPRRSRGVRLDTWRPEGNEKKNSETAATEGQRLIETWFDNGRAESYENWDLEHEMRKHVADILYDPSSLTFPMRKTA